MNTTDNNSTVTIKKHYINELAYFDSFSGMIPCKVINISNDKITVKLTGTRGAYKRGEILTFNTLHIVPRESVHFRKYETTISNNYQWIVS